MARVGDTALAVLAAIASAVVAFFASTRLGGIDPGSAFYIAMTIGSTVGSLVAATKGEKLGLLASFAALLALLSLMTRGAIPASVLTFETARGTVAIPSDLLPWLGVATIAFLAASIAAGGSPTRAALFVLVVLLTAFAYYTTEVAARVLAAALSAVAVFTPFASEQRRPSTPLLAAPAAALSWSDALLLAIPLAAFVALDPMNLVKDRRYREIAALAVLFLALGQILAVA